MNLRKNILANYVGQTYVTLIGIVMVPMYIRYMGVEAYGLVGFFAMLQAWFQLLDFGLTPTMARETARFNGGAGDALNLRRLLRALEGIFVAIAVLGAGAVIAGSGAIAGSWLNIQELPLGEVKHAIMLMAAIVALRWVCGLYRGAINGFERLVWLNGFNILIATARFGLVIPYFIYVGSSPVEFFTYQLAVAMVEVLVLGTRTYHLLPRVGEGKRVPWQWAPLRAVLKFSLSIAFASLAWIMVTQTDKLVLSKLLSLTDYAYFTLAVLAASGVLVIGGPISSALLPRLTRLSAENNEAGLIHLYRSASQGMVIIAIPVALVLAFFAEPVLWAWTGDAEVSRKAAPVLTLYALGNGILALTAFPYYLQFAKGDMKLHLIGNALFVLLLIPVLVWSTWRYGVTGAGYAWLAANAAYFLLWVPRVHGRFMKGLHTKWLLVDLASIVLPTAAMAALAYWVVKWPQERMPMLLDIGMVSMILVITAVTSSPWMRRTMCNKWRAAFPVKG